MHPLPSVTVLPFPRAPHQGPLMADAQGAMGQILHLATGEEKRPEGCPQAAPNLTSSHRSGDPDQQFLSPPVAGLGSWAPVDLGVLLVAPTKRGQAKVPKWARLPFLGSSVSLSEVLASALHCLPGELAGGDTVLVSDLLETLFHAGMGRPWQQEPVGPWD